MSIVEDTKIYLIVIIFDGLFTDYRSCKTIMIETNMRIFKIDKEKIFCTKVYCVDKIAGITKKI